jgi:glycosyltransferase involved in cell wall biosynthesis
MGGKLAIYIPAYNEERSIGSVVLQAKKYGRVIVVDDGSADRTMHVAISAGAKVIGHGTNRGYGAALRTILESARLSGAEAFVIMDGDYQHDPSEIPLIAKPVVDGRADVAVGSRFAGKFVGQPFYRKEGVALLNGLAKMETQKNDVDL